MKSGVHARGGSPDQLIPDLDPIHTAIIQRTLDVLTGQVELTTEEAESWRPRAIPEEWRRVITVVVAAARGDTDATEELKKVVTELAKTEGKLSLVKVFGHIVAGARSPDLLDRLDPTDTLVVTSILGQLTPGSHDDQPSASP